MWEKMRTLFGRRKSDEPTRNDWPPAEIRTIELNMWENGMSKKKNAGFSYTDGKKVGRTPGGAFSVKSPLALSIPAGKTVVVKTGVKCSNPLFLYQASSLAKRGVEITATRCLRADAVGRQRCGASSESSRSPLPTPLPVT